MLGISSNPRQRLQKRARKQVRQGTRDARHALGRIAGRGKHRAEALRDSLPAADDVMHDLREQAQPVMGRVQQATGRRKRSRSKKPFLLVGLLVLAGVVAYIFFSRRDQEPAYLVSEPDQPDTEPATGPSSGPAREMPVDQSPRNGSLPEWRTPSPAGAPTADLTAAGTTGALGHHPATPSLPDASLHAPEPAPTRSPEATPAPSTSQTPAETPSRAPAQSTAPATSGPTQASVEREPSHAGSSTSPSASTASVPGSLYEAWSAPGPASRAAWDLPRSATPPTQRRPGI